MYTRTKCTETGKKSTLEISHDINLYISFKFYMTHIAYKFSGLTNEYHATVFHTHITDALAKKMHTKVLLLLIILWAFTLNIILSEFCFFEKQTHGWSSHICTYCINGITMYTSLTIKMVYLTFIGKTIMQIMIIFWVLQHFSWHDDNIKQIYAEV